MPLTVRAKGVSISTATVIYSSYLSTDVAYLLLYSHEELGVQLACRRRNTDTPRTHWMAVVYDARVLLRM